MSIYKWWGVGVINDPPYMVGVFILYIWVTRGEIEVWVVIIGCVDVGNVLCWLVYVIFIS